MKKEEIKNLKPGDPVVVRFVQGSVYYVSKDGAFAHYLVGDDKKKTGAKDEDVFILSPKIDLISKLVQEAWKSLNDDFNASLLNLKIRDQFVFHWRNMCEAGDDKNLYEIAFNDFYAFLKELYEVSEKAKSLRVSNIPLLKEY